MIFEMNMKRCVILSLIVFAVLFQSGCFTGIESTPRITDKEVVRHNAVESREEKFASALVQDGFSEWKPGKELVVVDDRITLLLTGDGMLSAGDTIVYGGYYEIPAVTGDSATVLTFVSVDPSPKSRSWDYRMESSALHLNGRKSFEVPFTVDLDIVDRAGKLLVGNRYYIMTSLWVNSAGEDVGGLRYVPVTVTDVDAGNSLYPLKVGFVTDDGRRSGVMMTVGKDRRSTRNFENIFAFDDPHLRYPSITDHIWELIVKGDIVAGMTREECRLSLGTPRDVKKGHNGSSYFEQWTYDNGAYLIFDDGLLSHYRK